MAIKSNKKTTAAKAHDHVMSRRITEAPQFFASIHLENTRYLTGASLIVVFLLSLDAKLSSIIKVYVTFYYQVMLKNINFAT